MKLLFAGNENWGIFYCIEYVKTETDTRNLG